MPNREAAAPTESLAAVYRGAARAALQGEHETLAVLLPDDLMPAPETFALVYAITGTTEAERMDGRDGFRKIAQTESAWCRAMLKRWAAHEHMVEHAR